MHIHMRINKNTNLHINKHIHLLQIYRHIHVHINKSLNLHIKKTSTPTYTISTLYFNKQIHLYINKYTHHSSETKSRTTQTQLLHPWMSSLEGKLFIS